MRPMTSLAAGMTSLKRGATSLKTGMTSASTLWQGGIPAGYAAWVTGTTVWRIADARIISPVRT